MSVHVAFHFFLLSTCMLSHCHFELTTLPRRVAACILIINLINLLYNNLLRQYGVGK
jgi:hypothetical protein